MPEKFTDAPMLTDRFDRAFVLASAHHRRQLRKGTDVPYLSHLLAVAAASLELGGNEDTAIGALLHDAVEDGGGPAMLERIRQEFGDVVAGIVAANSDTDIEPKPPWRARKEAYIAGIASKPVEALHVSLADKLHNARAIVTDLERVGETVWGRFSAPADEVRWYYNALATAFAARAHDMGPAASAGISELRRLVVSMGGSPVVPGTKLDRSGRQGALRRLAAAFPYGHELRLDGSVSSLLLDVDPVPVLVELQGSSGDVWVRAMVGTARGTDTDEGLLREYLEEVPAGGASILLDGDEIWMLKSLPVPIDLLDTETLVLVVRGIAASAAQNTDTIDDVGLDLIAPRTFDEAVDSW